MSESQPDDGCACENPEALYTQFETRQLPGYDETGGRFGQVCIHRCRSCNRLWLEYSVEYEGFTGSGRWARCLVSEDVAETMTPETALDYLHAQPWYIRGGSYFGKARVGKRPLHWGI